MTARDLGPRFPQRLAGFAGDEVGEFLLARADVVGEAAQRLDPVATRCAPPIRARRRARRRPRPRHRRSRPTRFPRRSPVRSKSDLSLMIAPRRRARRSPCRRVRVKRKAASWRRPSGGSRRSWPRTAPSRRARAIAAQIASTSSMCIEQGAASRPIGMVERAGSGRARRALPRSARERLASDSVAPAPARRASRRTSGRSSIVCACAARRACADSQRPVGSLVVRRDAQPAHQRRDQRRARTAPASRRAAPPAPAPRRSAPGSRRAAPRPSGSPRAGGRRRRARHGRNKRR